MDDINPATGARIDTYETDTAADIEAALARAADAANDWRDRPIRERERHVAAAGDVLRENTQTYAELITAEMGKPITQARAEIEKCAAVCDHYATHASAYLQPDGHPSPAGADVQTVYEPLGPVLAVMPWNFPFWQVFRFAAPALAAGNVALLKHASNVPGCAEAIADVFEAAGLPAGVFQTLLVGADAVEDVIRDDRVRAATLTGSEPAGSAVAATAGETLKKTVLELGGSDPFVVLDDADVAAAAASGAWARTLNSGQSCIAAKRFIVHTDVYEAFRDAFVSEIDSLTVGDPTREETDVGPQASAAGLDTTHEQVRASVDAGATVVTGGQPSDREGAFYEPTVLTDVPAGCPADTEELFGPVAAVFEVPDEAAAIAKANATAFGLGASVWTADRDRGRRVARAMDAGCAYVNQPVTSDPRVPFGGIGRSGYGRELAGAGIRAFVNRKTLWVE
ncbi:NAD-dependent succinate-semialdehyde dehydrogenase [Halobacterium salinarum]|uniref:Succinate-semialdehyde dehydrogenase n=6 Tax=Halobacterium salinarum TaxID=2242 RepID=Q9HR91_HALSA|nr:NAD-dependent succinate-semialdehyde dehydrogenase [Halobacterium salinarum]AAG19267.1 succinate-semialdehyde dehydrogenase [Halobacterium salinarum NRC-1]MBB6090380.1 succinate-semialdehyde dehydrogenase/glutarate-semialdehyde dehydrogenase [Halobacterium salinarum]MDL0120824.1 NAD-dependent succinate-semialdehyde dehydrogenase [Halobacterium salinarum]MDL0130701.1 NAD-dependent succinate-semialdehyde dehydrogenase [Halobacterium salinarum]MDL0133207.1 NAD-dependent succinate-semialdehyde 